MLCLTYRHKYINEGDEELMADMYDNERVYCMEGVIQKMSKAAACRTYGLTEWDLDGLAFTVQRYRFY